MLFFENNKCFIEKITILGIFNIKNLELSSLIRIFAPQKQQKNKETKEQKNI